MYPPIQTQTLSTAIHRGSSASADCCLRWMAKVEKNIVISDLSGSPVDQLVIYTDKDGQTIVRVKLYILFYDSGKEAGLPVGRNSSLCLFRSE